jgi:hypothetical protein
MPVYSYCGHDNTVNVPLNGAAMLATTMLSPTCMSVGSSVEMQA